MNIDTDTAGNEIELAPEIIENQSIEEAKLNITGFVNKIEVMGQVEIIFNDSMFIPNNISWINSTVLDMYII